MWILIKTFLTSRIGLASVVAVIGSILVGVLLFQKTLMKSEIATLEAKNKKIQVELDQAKVAIEGYKGTIDGREKELAACKKQAISISDAVEDYKEKLDKLYKTAKNWKTVLATKPNEVLDEKSNSEAIHLLNECVPFTSSTDDKRVRKERSKN